MFCFFFCNCIFWFEWILQIGLFHVAPLAISTFVLQMIAHCPSVCGKETGSGSIDALFQTENKLHTHILDGAASVQFHERQQMSCPAFYGIYGVDALTSRQWNIQNNRERQSKSMKHTHNADVKTGKKKSNRNLRKRYIFFHRKSNAQVLSCPQWRQFVTHSPQRTRNASPKYIYIYIYYIQLYRYAHMNIHSNIHRVSQSGRERERRLQSMAA